MASDATSPQRGRNAPARNPKTVFTPGTTVAGNRNKGPEARSSRPSEPNRNAAGSSWDVGTSPDQADSRHLAEWIQGSAAHPALAAANVQTLQGSAVLEALAGDRLEAMGGHASQYATGAVARLLRLLEHLAEAGGWWCSGLDPLADWAPMAWGQLKPDQPRLGPDGKPIKYEAPWGAPTRSIWLRVPAVVAQLVADRFGLTLPPEVAADATGAAGAFWRWVARTPALPVVVTEGAKKAASLLSAGLPAVALPGVDSGAKRSGPEGFDGRRSGPIELLADLAAFPWAQREALVLFDHSDSAHGRQRVAAAADRLGHKLAATGAAVRVGACPGPHKGADDHLAAGGSWEALAEALRPLAPSPALPRLRRPDLIAPAGQHLSATLSPADLAHPLVAVAAPMGAGKSWLARQRMAPFLEAGTPTLAPTHRVVLGESQAESIGIPWAPQPGTDERLQGAGLCWDSFRPSSGLQIRPDGWDGADGLGPALLGDEISQGIEHVLFGTGTAVAEHRPEIMATVGAMAARARFGLFMDAQLSEPVLQLLEALSGRRAFLIGSAHQPMAGRPVLVPQGLTPRTAAERGRGRILQLAKDRRRGFVVTTAQKAGAKGSARNIARLVRRHWPEARILVIDSESPEAAELLGGDPNGIAAAFDWIICSPSITSGLSIDAPGLFDAVVVIGAGGQLTCEHLAQAAARVRDPRCPVEVYAPALAPLLRIGSGDTDPAALLRHLAACEARLLADLVGAAGWEPCATNESPWLRCWLALAAHRNRQSFAYSVTVAAMLEAEGWAVTTDGPAPPVELQQQAAAELAEIAEEAQAAADAAVIAATPISDQEARDLARKRRRTPEEQAQLARHHLSHRWGLNGRPPTPEILEADRDGLSGRLRFAWILQSIEARQLGACYDRARARQLAPNGKGWAPDLVRELLGHKLAAADALGLPALLEGAGGTITPEALAAWDLTREEAQGPETLEQEAQRRARNARRGDRRQLLAVLGLSPGKRASGTLRAVARLIGCRLEARRGRCGNGQRCWAYRLVPEALPTGADRAMLEAAWRLQLANPS
jgi:hypothetical protein